ncbi:MAG: methionine adenosyltransferase [Erysipelothrix sp.]|nr:methionine adenosyltransferase [Erysipelothrix sp.]
MKVFFTSESITPGHPDKICDQIADAILDAALSEDKHSKVAVEASIKDNFLFIFGEITTKAQLDYSNIAQKVIKEIGYDFEYEIVEKISRQSPEINKAVNGSGKIAAGDQGIMFGYACNETESFMPLSIEMAHHLAQRLTKVFLNQKSEILKPDGKTQVTVEYVDGKISRIDTIVVSTQHYENISQAFLKTYIFDNVISPIIDKDLIDENTKIYVNPSGSFIVGGSYGDSGTTGRKIVVDTYGGHGRIGGGALSSKDPSKVDRSAAYYARYVAKNIVANKLAEKFEIQVSYAIGMVDPLSININTFNTSKHTDQEILDIIRANFDFSVDNIIKELDLLRPIYRQTANFGHFGRNDLQLPWEQVIKLKLN